MKPLIHILFIGCYLGIQRGNRLLFFPVNLDQIFHLFLKILDFFVQGKLLAFYLERLVLVPLELVQVPLLQAPIFELNLLLNNALLLQIYISDILLLFLGLISIPLNYTHLKPLVLNLVLVNLGQIMLQGFNVYHRVLGNQLQLGSQLLNLG